MTAWVERGTAPDAVVARQPARAGGGDFGAPRGAGGMGPRPQPAPGAQAAALGPDGKPPAPLDSARPVYPWPYMAAWDGKGDPRQAASYVRGAAIGFVMPAWAGADFFVRGQGRDASR